MIRRAMRRRVALPCLVLGACGFSAPGALDPAGDDAPGDDAPAGGDTLDDGLIAWYPMDRLAGSTVEDATGRGHTGTCATCPAVVPGRLGSGFRFGGPNARIDVPSMADLRLTSGFTVALWLSFDAPPASEYSCTANKLLNGTVYNTWQLCYRMSNQSWFFGTQTSSGFAALEEPAPPAAGTWHHLAIWWDGDRKQIWLNGAKIDEATVRGVVFDDAPITIGADIDNNAHRHGFPGILDEIRIYDRPLTGSEIARLASP